MASISASATTLILPITLSVAFLASVLASDPDITSDFVVPQGITPDGNFFTHRELRNTLWGTTPVSETEFILTKASQTEFPALVGLGVSMAVLEYGPTAINPPHIHPRASELLLVIGGWLEVGLVTSDNKLLVQTLQAGDMFVFPKGLVHYQVNRDVKYSATAVAAFGSANAGAVLITRALVGAGISTDVLAKSFRVDEKVIEKLVWPSVKY